MLKFTYNSKGELMQKGSVITGDDSYTSRLFSNLEKSLKSNESLKNEALSMYKALDTQTAGDGGNLIETILFRGVMERVRLFGNVAPLFRDLVMPSATFDIPVELADAIVYAIPENTASTGQTGQTASNPTFSKAQLIAKKFGGKTIMSAEIEQDSVIDLISYVVDNHAKALARGLDSAILDGDVTATHQDSDTTASTDVRKQFAGLRKLANAGSLTINGAAATLTIAKILEAKALMGKYAQGDQASNLALIVSSKTYSFLENLAYATANNNMLVFGFNNGRLSSIAGIPVVSSELIREDLTANAVFTGVGAFSYALLVNTSRFVTGTRLGVTMSSDMNYEFDQGFLYSKVRKGFTALEVPSVSLSTVAIIRNITVV